MNLAASHIRTLSASMAEKTKSGHPGGTMKYRSSGWNAIKINGNDCNRICKSLDAAEAEAHRPALTAGKCIQGEGARKKDHSSAPPPVMISLFDFSIRCSS